MENFKGSIRFSLFHLIDMMNLFENMSHYPSAMFIVPCNRVTIKTSVYKIRRPKYYSHRHRFLLNKLLVCKLVRGSRPTKSDGPSVQLSMNLNVTILNALVMLEDLHPVPPQ